MSGGGAVDGAAPPAPAGGGRFAGLHSATDRDRDDQQRDNGSRYGDRGGDRSGGGGYRRDGSRGGAYNSDNRGGYDRPAGRGGDMGDRDDWRRRDGSQRSPANNDGRARPRLQLKSRDAAATEEPTDNSGSSRPGDPQVVNSRAAGLGGENPDSGRGVVGRRDTRNDGPPPVLNSKFERMAEEEREKRARREERGPPPFANSRFAAAAESGRTTHDERGGSSFEGRGGPPPLVNSRFAAAADADRTTRGDYRNNDRGPPPIANSRFAAAAEADGGRSNYGDRERGPPPLANSRFAAAAGADRSSSYQSGRSDRPSRDGNDRPSRYDDNTNRGDRSRFSDRGPPPVANSRFANAAYRADEDNRERDERRRDRYASRDRFDGARSRFDPKYVEESEPEVNNSRMEELLLKRIQKKDQEVILEPKAKEHEANMFQIPVKALVKEEEDFFSYRKKAKEEQQAADPPKQEKPKGSDKVSIAEVNADATEEVMREFVHGGLLGNDLKTWCTEKRLVLPTIEKLLKYFLKEHEKLNPDPDCAWAEPDQYGAAFVSIVDDDLFKQMQVLWAIQEYCDGLGFPTHNDESVVQAMFRSMYKYDLAEAGAFQAWKEDESETHEKGKMTAIMQTVDWFNWLEEDDEEDEED